MNRSIAQSPAARFALVALVALVAGVVAGCGSSLPPNGATGNPIDPEVAKQQNSTVSEYYRKNPRGYETKVQGGRH